MTSEFIYCMVLHLRAGIKLAISFPLRVQWWMKKAYVGTNLIHGRDIFHEISRLLW